MGRAKPPLCPNFPTGSSRRNPRRRRTRSTSPRVDAPSTATQSVSCSFRFGWFGNLLLNLPKFVASQPFVFGGLKSFRRLLVVTQRGQGQFPVLNLVDGDNHLADATFLAGRTILDGGV